MAESRAGPRVCKQSDDVLHTIDASTAGIAAAAKVAFCRPGERYQLANVRRIEGRIALAGPAPDRARAEQCFLQAIEFAREQEVPLYELRAATELARLWRDSRAAAELRALLEPLIAAVQGGLETRDVREARALLARL